MHLWARPLSQIISRDEFYLSTIERMASISIRADQQGRAISPLLHGIFFEDINFAGDGGLCPQLVKNGSFEFLPNRLLGWRKVERGGAGGSLSIRCDQPLNSVNPNYLRINIWESRLGFGTANEGFRGMGVRAGTKYHFSAYIRSDDAHPMPLRVELLTPTMQLLAAAALEGVSKQWAKYSCLLEVQQDEPRAELHIIGLGVGSFDIEQVSLLPADSPLFRADLLRLLKDLKPKFLRFPGGCIVEGRLLSNRYQWKKTIGDVSERPIIVNRWNSEFKHRLAPDYFQSFGIGFFEYFLLCEELGAAPLPIVNCGMACQFNSSELAPMDQLDEYIADAIDLIEFANGSSETPWGRKRSELGHPAPFELTMLGIGNEQWGPQYIERYERFAGAIKTKYPYIKLIAAAGPSPDGAEFEYAWERLRELQTDLIDEHYYRSPQWFMENADRYDHYKRSGPKVFAGEFAAQSVGVASADNRNNWQCALAEAAFMTGLERNGDVVSMACYAPLLGHVDAWQWTPNLIWFDNLSAFGTPSYYVQKLFAEHSGNVSLPIERNDETAGLYASAVRHDGRGELIVKLVNVLATPLRVTIQWSGLNAAASGESYVLAAKPDVENSLESPLRVSPFRNLIQHFLDDSEYFLPPYSLTVLRVFNGR